MSVSQAGLYSRQSCQLSTPLASSTPSAAMAAVTGATPSWPPDTCALQGRRGQARQQADTCG
jgi:hypothetical protein